MFTTAHTTYSIGIGFIIAKIFGWVFGWPEILFMFVIGNLPDFDRLWELKSIIKQGVKYDIEEHRSYISHAPLFWVMALSILYFFISIKFFILSVGAIILHFIMDSIEEINGIRWFYPIYRKFYKIFH